MTKNDVYMFNLVKMLLYTNIQKKIMLCWVSIRKLLQRYSCIDPFYNIKKRLSKSFFFVFLILQIQRYLCKTALLLAIPPKCLRCTHHDALGNKKHSCSLYILIYLMGKNFTKNNFTILLCSVYYLWYIYISNISFWVHL